MAKPETWVMMEEYFSPDEFGKGAYEGIEDSFLLSLFQFRVAMDNPIYIHDNGGFTTTGHSENSYHYQGRAIDFHFKYNPVHLRRLVVAAVKCGLYGIGMYPHWMPKPGGFHLDNRPGGRFNVWSRNENGIYTYLFSEQIAESLEEWAKWQHQRQR
jgi:hypothetical protein